MTKADDEELADLQAAASDLIGRFEAGWTEI
jgi:hypothetical protein